MSKREKEKKESQPSQPESTGPSSEGPVAPEPSEADRVQEQILKIADAMNQYGKLVEGLAERTTKIEESLAGLGEALKAAANPGKPGGFDLGSMLQTMMLREMGGGGEAEKLIKTFADNYLKTISPEGQRAMISDLLSIFERGIRLGRMGVEPKEARETFEHK